MVNNNSDFSEDIVTPWKWSKTETCRSFFRWFLINFNLWRWSCACVGIDKWIVVCLFLVERGLCVKVGLELVRRKRRFLWRPPPKNPFLMVLIINYVLLSFHLTWQLVTVVSKEHTALISTMLMKRQVPPKDLGLMDPQQRKQSFRIPRSERIALPEKFVRVILFQSLT